MKIDEIEYKVANGQLTAHQTFTQMNQHIENKDNISKQEVIILISNVIKEEKQKSISLIKFLKSEITEKLANEFRYENPRISLKGPYRNSIGIVNETIDKLIEKIELIDKQVISKYEK